MMTVVICGMINSCLLGGLVAGIVVGMVRARVAIADALGGDVAHPLVVRGRAIPA